MSCYQVTCSPTRFARSPVRYVRPVRVTPVGCGIGTPNILNPFTGSTLYTSNNDKYAACQAYKKPSGNPASINLGTTFSNSLLKGPMGICCGDYEDAKNYAVAALNNGLTQGLLCGNKDKMYADYPLLAVVPGIDTVVDKTSGLVKSAMNSIPCLYEGNLAAGSALNRIKGDSSACSFDIKPATGPFIPIRSLVCGKPMPPAPPSLPPAMGDVSEDF